jgi:hypothetical protein
MPAPTSNLRITNWTAIQQCLDAKDRVVNAFAHLHQRSADLAKNSMAIGLSFSRITGF